MAIGVMLPQLSDLGRSGLAQRYGIAGLDEARPVPGGSWISTEQKRTIFSVAALPDGRLETPPAPC